MASLTRDKTVVCGVQGRLFELSARKGYSSATFIDAFMSSETAKRLDSAYDRLQWAGEEYILEELEDELGSTLATVAEQPWSNEELFWIGHTYRLWHYLTNESSAEISRIADARTMRACWPGYHTLDSEMAIARLREAASIPLEQ